MKTRMYRWLITMPSAGLLSLCIVLGFQDVSAADEIASLSTSQQERFQRLVTEIRCVVCQNQSIADSNADLAKDLRREVQLMIAADKTDAQILEFMVARYGDFVLYSPPLDYRTAVLWFGPFLGLAFAAGSLWVLLIRRRRAVEATRMSLAEAYGEDRLKEARARLEGRM